MPRLVRLGSGQCSDDGYRVGPCYAAAHALHGASPAHNLPISAQAFNATLPTTTTTPLLLLGSVRTEGARTRPRPNRSARSVRKAAVGGQVGRLVLPPLLQLLHAHQPHHLQCDVGRRRWGVIVNQPTEVSLVSKTKQTQETLLTLLLTSSRRFCFRRVSAAGEFAALVLMAEEVVLGELGA